MLKRKLDQVAQFGCTAFALLFDDIEPEMSESDKEAFQSFAQAQVNQTIAHILKFLVLATPEWLVGNFAGLPTW